MRRFLCTTAIFLSLCYGFQATDTLAKENTIKTEKQTISSKEYEELRQIMLEGSPEQLQKMIQNGLDINGVYHCETPLIMAIGSLAYAFGSATGFPLNML